MGIPDSDGRAPVAAAGLVTLLLSAMGGIGCATGDDQADSQLTISAASSLVEAFETYGESIDGEERFSFAGSDELAAQIRQGARPDVFAAANTALPDALHEEGLVSRPVEFARNRLVIAVPVGDDSLQDVADLSRPGLDLVLGAEGVPIGDYTGEVLGRLPQGQRDAILANVRSEEPEVKGIVGKLAIGAADAGFVYASDVAATAGDLRAIDLPPRLQPQVTYAAAVVTGSDGGEEAQAFIDGLLAGAGADALAGADFLPPPP